jgi:hypothetical protein
LGHLEEGRALLKPLIEKSVSQGWSKFWDGGSRLCTAQAFVEFYPKEGRKKIYDLLIKDYLSEWRDPESVLQNLEDYLPLLFEDVPLAEIWEEIREHVYQLREFKDTEILPPEIEVNSMSWNAVLLELVKDALQIKISEVREEAHRALCKICQNPAYDDESTALLNKMLASDETQIYQALAVMESIVKQRPQFLITYQEKITNLLVSPNFVLRSMATELAQILGIPIPEPPFRPLPFIYKLELPPFQTLEAAIPHTEISDSSFPDIDDPIEIATAQKSI